MLLVAYPNKDKNTEFEFEYYTGQYSSFGNQIAVIAVEVVVGVFLICCVCACLVRRRENPNRVEVVDTETPAGKDVE